MSLRTSSLILLSGVTMASVALVGCSSSSSSPSTSPSSAAATPSGLPMPTFTGANAQFCDAMAAAAVAGGDLGAAREDGNSAAESAASQQFLASLQAALAAVPADAPADFKTELQQAITIVQSEQASPSPNPSAAAAGEKLDAAIQAYVPKACPEMPNAG